MYAYTSPVMLEPSPRRGLLHQPGVVNGKYWDSVTVRKWVMRLTDASFHPLSPATHGPRSGPEQSAIHPSLTSKLLVGRLIDRGHAAM